MPTARAGATTAWAKWSHELNKTALRKLRMLDAAEELTDLRVPPGNRLERLRGDRQGKYSIRINDQWRICFRWDAGNAYDVEIVDFHEEMMMVTRLPAVHPGEVLLEEFLAPTGLSQYRLAKDISVPPRRINEIVHGKRAVTANTALRLARYSGRPRGSGSTSRPSTTSTSKPTDLATDSTVRLPLTPAELDARKP